jgi:hypothetical protein
MTSVNCSVLSGRLISRNYDMSNLPVNRPLAKRRSVRLALNVPVRLDGHDRQKGAFTLLPGHATNLNRHGGAIQVGRELLVGSTLSVRHDRGGIKTPARISRTSKCWPGQVYLWH